MDTTEDTAANETRLFVGNLAWGTTDLQLKDAFDSELDEPVLEAKVITDRYTGRSRGFGFVTCGTHTQAAQAMERMHNRELHGRQIRVDKATSQRRN